MAPNHAKEGMTVHTFDNGDKGHYSLHENGKGETGQQTSGHKVFAGSNDTVGLQNNTKVDLCSKSLGSQLGRETGPVLSPTTKVTQSLPNVACRITSKSQAEAADQIMGHTV